MEPRQQPPPNSHASWQMSNRTPSHNSFHPSQLLRTSQHSPQLLYHQHIQFSLAFLHHTIHSAHSKALASVLIFTNESWPAFPFKILHRNSLPYQCDTDLSNRSPHFPTQPLVTIPFHLSLMVTPASGILKKKFSVVTVPLSCVVIIMLLC